MPERTGWADPNWRRWRVESIRRSLAMLNDGQASGLSRDEATRLVEELQRVDHELRQLREGLRHLLDETAN